MSQPLEIHLNEKKLNIIDKNLFDIYFPTKEVCNLFLWHKYRKVMNIIMPDKILRFIFEPIFRIALKKNNQNMLIPFRHHANNLAKKNINIIWQAQDVNGVLEKTDPTISFTKDEENKGYDFFKKNNIFENVKGIILSGGPSSVTKNLFPKIPNRIFNLNIPILGICYGLQLIAKQFKGKVKANIKKREFGRVTLIKKKKKKFTEYNFTLKLHTQTMVVLFLKILFLVFVKLKNNGR
jgi:hypothetical protein